MRIAVDGFSLYLRVEGKEGGLGDILLLHCLGLNHCVFEHQIEFLTREGFRVFAPDMRGHGESDKPDVECVLDDLVDDVLRLCERMGLKKFFAIGGISMGGMIAMRLFIRRPNIASKLILMGTSADREPYLERYRGIIYTLIEKFKRGEVTDDDKRSSAEFVVRLCFSPEYLEKGENFERWVSEALKASGLCTVYVSRAVIERDSIIDKIGAINVPVCIMAGERDMAIPVEEAYKIHNKIKGSKIIIFPSAPHIFTPEIPEAVNNELKKFLFMG